MTVPPIHPIFVHFPIALLIVSVVADILGRAFNSVTLRATGWWALFGAALGGIAAIATGLLDMYREPISDAAHKYVDFHEMFGFAVLAAAAILTIWRGVLWYRERGPNAAYFTAAVLAMLLVMFQGFVGGELVYSYGVGVPQTGQSTETPRQAQSRLHAVEKALGPFEEEAHHHGAPPPAEEPQQTEQGGHHDENSHGMEL